MVAGRWSLLSLLSLAALGCVERPLDVDRDFSEEVEQICHDYCTTKLTCDPMVFESYAACDELCMGYAFIYNDSACGEAHREVFGCIGGVETCELYFDTQNVGADDYTCRAEKERISELGCFGTDEPPDEGAP